MKELWTLLGVEMLKLRRSLALVACIVGPLIVATLQIVVLLRRGPLTDPGDLARSSSMSALSIWSIFMLPLLAALVLTLVFVQERPHGGWQVLYSLPVARWSIVAAKQLVTLALLLISTLVLLLLVLAGFVAVRWLAPHYNWPPISGVAPLLGGAGRLFLAALGLLGIQAWVALRAKGVVTPLAVGVGGVFFAVFASGWERGHYYPWLMPLHALQRTPGKGGIALLLGATLGLTLFLGALYSSTRRPPKS